MISVIVPVFNEQDNVLLLAREITLALSATQWSWECVWVDDGSDDNTLPRLLDAAAEEARHKVFCHNNNYGQSAALVTGFRKARGKIFVTIDGDGQNDPQSIPELVRVLIEGRVDVVNGWRDNRQDTFVRKLSSRVANFARNRLTHERVRDVGCSLRALRRECVEEIPIFKGMHRFIPTLIRMMGHTKIIEMPVKHRPRKHGKTKYGINNRLWAGLLDTLAVRWMLSRRINPANMEKKPCAE